GESPGAIMAECTVSEMAEEPPAPTRPLLTTATLAPCLRASIAARRAACPPPITKTSAEMTDTLKGRITSLPFVTDRRKMPRHPSGKILSLLHVTFQPSKRSWPAHPPPPRRIAAGGAGDTECQRVHH